MSFRLKTVLGIAIIELTVMAILIGINQFALGGSASSQLFERAESTSRVFANAVADAVIATDLATLDSTIQAAVSSEELTYLRIKNPAGIVLSQSGAENALAAPFVRDTSYDAALSDQIIDIDLPIVIEGTNFGTIELGLSTVSVENEIANAFQMNLIVAAIGMSLVAVFGFGLGSMLTGQLKWLREGARQISAGNLDRRIAIRGRDELAETALCFNQMAEALKRDRAKLLDQTNELLANKARVEVIVECMTAISQGAATADVPDTDREDEIGNMARATVVFHESRQEVERARREQQQLISAFDQVAEQVAIFSDDGEVLFMNAAFLSFNSSILEAVGKKFTLKDFLNAGLNQGAFPEVTENHEDWVMLIDSLEDGVPFEMVRAPDSVFLTAFTGVQGIGTVMSAKDITEFRRSENQLIQASKMATLGEMATGMAHELNQPLGVIRMAAANCKRRIEKGSCDPDYLSGKFTRISEQTERAAKIIEHMRIFGRKAEGILEPFDLCASVQEVANLADTQLQTLDIGLEVDLPEGPVAAVGEKVIFEQVLLNLVSNARDAIEDQKGLDHRIQISVKTSNDGRGIVTVQDTGGGIPEEIQDRLFEPFFTTKEPGKGTGLGLSISYGTIEGMSGTLSVKNQGSGACFTISLPNAVPSESLRFG